MPIDMAPPSSNIQGYQIASPQSVDPLQTLSQMGQLKQQAVQTQNAQMQLQNARGLMAAYHDAGGDIDKMAEIAPQYGVMPDEILKVKQAVQSLAKDRAQTLLSNSEAAKNQVAATDAKHDALNAAYQDVYGIKDPNQQYAELQSTNQGLVNQGWDPKDLLQATGPGDVAQVMQQGKSAYRTANWIKEDATRQLQQAQTGESTAKAGQAQAESELTQTKQQVEQHKLELYGLYTANPKILQQKVAQSIDPQKYPNLYQRALNSASMQPDMDGITKVIDDYAKVASEQEKTVSTETNPTVVATRVGQAVATAKALRQGDNPAVANVAPAAVMGVQNEAIKLDQAQVKANEASEAIGRVIDLVMSGNKAAGSNLPVLGVGAMNAINGIKRFNTPEIRGYGQAGSLMDKIEGEFSGLATGKPITDTVLNDIRQLHQELANSSYNAYTQGLKSLNERTRSQFEPTVPPPSLRGGTNQGQQQGQQGGQKITVNAGGKPHYFNSEAAARIFENNVRKAGGTSTRQ